MIRRMSGERQGALRLFVAIPVPDEVRRSVAEVIDRLDRGFRFTAWKVNWTSADSVHLTLRFLGRTEESAAERIQEGLGGIARVSSPFRLGVGGLGVFPDWKAPKVLWMGIRDGSGRLAALQDAVSRLAESAGIAAEDRAFHPHLTLGRIKYIRNISAGKNLVAGHGKFGAAEFVAEEMNLYSSELKAEGAEHRILQAYRLGEVQTGGL